MTMSSGHASSLPCRPGLRIADRKLADRSIRLPLLTKDVPRAVSMFFGPFGKAAGTVAVSPLSPLSLQTLSPISPAIPPIDI